MNKVAVLSLLILGCFMVTSHGRTVDQMDSNKVWCYCVPKKCNHKDCYCCSDMVEPDCYSSLKYCRHKCCSQREPFALAGP
ncbi:hypothetical protein EJB05_15732 [Eragrostis curvula]|uniref:Embryo surrounding factor 1 brassicaceae domain-containing protein n=1 Tax=Eragrostis curvula TaxID=38414 RepID=A0A5J9VD61_9POAL|nr:hypothetical protein EJB05_15732 [Eragrostis curvula]